MPKMKFIAYSFLLVIGFGNFSWSAAQTVENTPKTTTEPNNAETIGQKIDKFFSKLIAGSSVYEINQYGTPRHVSRGKKPEVIIRNDTITINGQPVYMFDTVDSWISALGPPSNGCKFQKITGYCVWLKYGITISTDNREGKPLVDAAILYLNVPQYSPYFFQEKSDSEQGQKAKKDTEKPPRKPMQLFPGYLEINGYGLNADTKQWEVLKGAKSWKDPIDGNFGADVGCHRDCHYASGRVGQNTMIYIGTNGNAKTEKIVDIQIDVSHRLKINQPKPQSEAIKIQK